MSKNRIPLKPCPFCGGRAKRKNFPDRGWFWVACPNCNISQTGAETPVKAAQNWNVRISPAPPVPPDVGVEADGGAGSVEEMSEKQEKKIMEPIKIGKLIELADILTDEAFYHDCDGEDQSEKAFEIYEMAHELLTKLETYAKEQERDHEIY